MWSILSKESFYAFNGVHKSGGWDREPEGAPKATATEFSFQITLSLSVAAMIVVTLPLDERGSIVPKLLSGIHAIPNCFARGNACHDLQTVTRSSNNLQICHHNK
jgi:hypothetical protein